MIKKRSSMIVKMHHLKSIRYLKRYGTVHYVSRRMKYAVVYCDEADYPQMSDRLIRQSFVEDVLPSYFGEVSRKAEPRAKARVEKKNPR